MNYEELKIKDKQKYLDENWGVESFKLLDQVLCLHCNQLVTVGKYKVFRSKGFDYICCPNAPECNGTIIDWMPADWADLSLQ